MYVNPAIFLGQVAVLMSVKRVGHHTHDLAALDAEREVGEQLTRRLLR